MQNRFSATVGYNGLPWSGAFIDVVARECGLELPACVYTPNALAAFVRTRRLHTKPQEGDLVFFNFSSEMAASSFAMPHIGIVTDVRQFKSTGKFLSLEANVSNGTSNGSDRDGVYIRIRHAADVIAFARPKFDGSGPHPGKLLTKLLKFISKEARLEAATIEQAAREKKTIPGNAIRPGARNRHIEVVQLALGVTVGLTGAARGHWDAATTNAFTNFQRRIGYVGTDANGDPNPGTLKRLGQETGLFTISE